jgi:hypothetical protein
MMMPIRPAGLLAVLLALCLCSPAVVLAAHGHHHHGPASRADSEFGFER